jgi:hypothetical protein
MPMTENQFLWDGVTRGGVLYTAVFDRTWPDRARLSQEGSQLAKWVITETPVEQAKVSSARALDQFFRVGVRRYYQTPRIAEFLSDDQPDEAQRVRNSLFFEDDRWLDVESRIMFASYTISLLAVLALCLRRGALSGPERDFGVLVLTGALVNASVFSFFSSSIDRYQGRVAWVVVLTAISLLLARRSAENPGLRPVIASV